MMDDKKVHEAKVMAVYHDLNKIEELAERAIKQGRFTQKSAVLCFIYADNAKSKLKEVT